jgi:SP family sugar:H+ symporter-like MFS transporter
LNGTIRVLTGLVKSPRWLLARGRKEDAIKSLHLLRQGAFTEAEIEAEMQGIYATIDLTVEDGRFKELFQGTNLKRTCIAVGAEVFVQLTGQNFSTNYGTYFINSLGTINPFAMTCINISVNIFMTLFTQVLTDRTGRVYVARISTLVTLALKIDTDLSPLMIAGAFLQCAALMTMGGLGTVTDPSLAIKAGITAMVTVFGAGFQLGWAPLSHVVASEVPTTRLRDLTYALGATLDIIVQWAITFSIPYLLDDIGSKLGFVFGVTSFGAVLFSIFCIPECRCKTLEEIDDLFLEGVPIRGFRTARSRLHDQYVEAEMKEDMPTAIQVYEVDRA